MATLKNMTGKFVQLQQNGNEVIMTFELDNGETATAKIPDITKVTNENWKIFSRDTFLQHYFRGLDVIDDRVVGSSQISVRPSDYIPNYEGQGTLTKIDPPKQSFTKKNGAKTFQRIYFEMADKSWAKTDLCHNFRNFSKWRPVIAEGVGARLSGLEYKDKDTIDADSNVKLI